MYYLSIFFLLLSIPAVAQNFTWMGGTTSPTAIYASYGPPNVFNPSVYPGSLRGMATWTATDGKLWMFGGYGGTATQSGLLNDLWVYDPASNLWAFVKGDQAPSNNAGNYGTQGIPSVDNIPPGWQNMTAWTGADGSFWMFGGWTGQYRNDLWKFNPSTQEWTWMHGSNAAQTAPGNYGQKGVSSSSNTPPGRSDGLSWRDANGNLWMYGGFTPGTSSNLFDDVWMYNVALNEWTWMAGSDTFNPAPVYGTLGIPDPANTPGGSTLRQRWTGADGLFWLYTHTGVWPDPEAELWTFNPLSAQWTWKRSYGNAPYYLQPGTEHPDAHPGPRSGAITWVDETNAFWLFGGNRADLWRYRTDTETWAFIKGDTAFGAPGVYTQLLMEDPVAYPAARDNAKGWTDQNGDIWLFGGNYGTAMHLNDLWKFTTPVALYTFQPSGTDPGIIVKPGLTSDVAVVSVNNVSGDGLVTMTSVDGKLVQTQAAATSSITFDLRGLPAGLYIFQYRDASGTAAAKYVKR